jgi:hypothetical protein
VEWGLTVSLRRKNPKVLMSALGQKQTSDQRPSMSALPPKTDITGAIAMWTPFAVR